MSGVPQPNDLATQIAAIATRLTRLEHQTQSYTIDESGRIVLEQGVIGLNGPDPTQGYGTALFDDNGIKRAQLGLQPNGLYNLTFFDNGGNPRVQLGQLEDGDYALAVFSLANDGTYSTVLPSGRADTPAQDSTASPTFTDLASGPDNVATVAIGASGKYLVRAYVKVLPGGSGFSGLVGFAIDGVVQSPTLIEGGVLGSLAGSFEGTASPGSHSFRLVYASGDGSGSSTIDFEQRVIEVEAF